MSSLRSTFENKKELEHGFHPAGNLDGTSIEVEKAERVKRSVPPSSPEPRTERKSTDSPRSSMKPEPSVSPKAEEKRPKPLSPAQNKYPVGHGLYLLDFIFGLVRKSNIPIIIYLILNVFVIGGICAASFDLPFGWGMLCGVILYVASVNVALSPIGEWILRTQNGCWKIDEVEVVNRIEPLFNEVYKKARKECPNLSKDIRLFMMADNSANAFATGRNTICITRGLLELSDEQIKGILAHEFGHLANMDTDLILLVSVGNLFVTAICVFFQLCVGFFYLMMWIVIAVGVSREDSLAVSAVNAFMHFLTMVVIAAIMKIWTWIGTVLCMKTSRSREFEADKFAWQIGYGKGLYIALDKMVDDYPPGFFKNLKQSHPQGSDRLKKLADYENAA